MTVTTIDNEEVPLEALKNAIGRLRTLRDHLLETGRPDLNQALLTIRSCASDLHQPTLVPTWVHNELQGYPADAELPNYRAIAVSCYATVSSPGWTMGDVHLYDVNIDFRDPVSILPVERATGLIIPRPDLRKTHQDRFAPGVTVVNVKGLITPSVCNQVAAAIQSRALSLVEGILGQCDDSLRSIIEDAHIPPSEGSTHGPETSTERGEFRKLVLAESVKGLWRHLPDIIKGIRPGHLGRAAGAPVSALLRQTLAPHGCLGAQLH